MIKAFSSYSKTLLWDRSNLRFAVGVWLGLSFSIAVILSTVGIMDGFIFSLKEGLKQSNGDITISSRSGFFQMGKETKKAFTSMGIVQMSELIESQAFVVANDRSKGIVLKGVDGDSYSQVTNQEILPEKDKVILGSELAKVLNIKAGEQVVLVMAQGNREMNGLPLLKRFEVQGIIKHGIYEKDLRFVYLAREILGEMLGTEKSYNKIALNIPVDPGVEEFDEAVEKKVFDIEDLLGIDYRVKPYWEDFRSMLEAVEIEKLTISLILQIIVIISIFNVLSFMTFLNERKSQEIFLFQALGLSVSSLRKTWFSIIGVLWVASCLFSLVLVEAFDWMLAELTILSLPGDVYHLGRLSLKLGIGEYLFVFGLTLFWLFLIIAFALYHLNKRSLLYGLRKEFS